MAKYYIYTHSLTAAHLKSVLHFNDLAIEDGWLHIMRDGDDFCDFLVTRSRDGLSHFFTEIWSVELSLPFRKEAVFTVQTVFRSDLTRRVVLNHGHDL